jgi:hypothetical protein
MEKVIDSAQVHRFSCFESLNAEQIATFAAHLEEVRLAPGEVLFKQGDQGDSIYLLLRGQILIKLSAPAPDDQILATLRAERYSRRDGSIAKHATNRDSNCQRRKSSVENLDVRLSRGSATRRRVGYELFARHRSGSRTPDHGHERGTGQTFCRVAPEPGATPHEKGRRRNRILAETADDGMDVLSNLSAICRA